MTDERPRLGGFILPQPSTVVWATVVGSAASYFMFSRAVANLIAIAGAIAVTVVLAVRDRAR